MSAHQKNTYLCRHMCRYTNNLNTHVPFTGYNEVVRIPSGATNIDVRQHSYSGKPEDDNYLGKKAKIVLVFFCCFFNVFFTHCAG